MIHMPWQRNSLVLLLLTLSFTAHSQLCFDAIPVRGCAPLEVRIQECVGPQTPKGSLRYNFDYRGGPITGTQDTFFTYRDPGVIEVDNTGTALPSGIHGE